MLTFFLSDLFIYLFILTIFLSEIVCSPMFTFWAYMQKHFLLIAQCFLFCLYLVSLRLWCPAIHWLQIGWESNRFLSYFIVCILFNTSFLLNFSHYTFFFLPKLSLEIKWTETRMSTDNFFKKMFEIEIIKLGILQTTILVWHYGLLTSNLYAILKKCKKQQQHQQNKLKELFIYI